MHLKNRQFFSRWEFFYLTPDGEEMRFPVEDGEYANNLDELQELAIAQFEQFGEEYKQDIAIKAAELSMTYPGYIRKSIEHQICLRSPEGVCWEDGFGDEIHTAFTKLDTMIEEAPEPIKLVGKIVTGMATKIATGKKQRSFGGCSACGGTRTFNPKAQNLGRAGRVNNLIRKYPVA